MEIRRSSRGSSTRRECVWGVWWYTGRDLVWEGGEALACLVVLRFAKSEWVGELRSIKVAGGDAPAGIIRPCRLIFLCYTGLRVRVDR